MKKYAIVCFYTASKGGNGAAEVSLRYLTLLNQIKNFLKLTSQNIN